MDKMVLIEARQESRIYYIDLGTGKFYMVPPKSYKDRGGLIFFLVIISGPTLTALRETIDRFYIPRATIMSNVLLLAAMIGVATIFHVWTKRLAKKKIKEQIDNLQPISLEDQKKEEIMRKTIEAGKIALGSIVGILLVAVILSVVFMITSRSVFYIWALVSTVTFAVVIQFTNSARTRIKVSKKWLGNMGVSL